MQNVTATPRVPRLAATVMLVRSAAGGPQVYLTRRSRASRFMPAVHVFPGGAVDAEDGSAEAARRLRGAPEPPGPAVAFAALRELFEEAGILLACDAGGDPVRFDATALGALRAELVAGLPFGAMLDRHGWRLDASGLAYYSNWVTPETEPIRFDAHFFVAEAPADQIAEADAVEVHDGEWIAPAEALARAERGDMAIIFPTRKHLERLAAFSDVAALVAHARARVVRRVMPVERGDGTIAFARAEDDAW